MNKWMATGEIEKIFKKSKTEMHQYDNAHWLSSLWKLDFQTLEEIINLITNKCWRIKTKTKQQQQQL